MKDFLLALLAVAGTFGGVWLGRYLERDNEARKWRREHALAAYIEVLRACAVVLEEADNIYHMDQSVARVAQGKLLFEKVSEMYRLSDKVALVGPQELLNSVSMLTGYYGKNIAARANKEPKPSEEEWRAIRTAAVPLYLDVLTRARNDLGVQEPLYRIDDLVNRG